MAIESMALGLPLLGIISIVFGLIVLAMPKILNYLVGIYLIIIGILQVLPYLGVVL